MSLRWPRPRDSESEIPLWLWSILVFLAIEQPTWLSTHGRTHMLLSNLLQFC